MGAVKIERYITVITVVYWMNVGQTLLYFDEFLNSLHRKSSLGLSVRAHQKAWFRYMQTKMKYR